MRPTVIYGNGNMIVWGCMTSKSVDGLGYSISVISEIYHKVDST